MIVALPAILAAFLMVLTTKEPERGATEDALKVGVFLPLLVVGREGDWEDSLPFSLHVLDPIEGHLQHHKVVKVD